jgi:hypothetical protein
VILAATSATPSWYDLGWVDWVSVIGLPLTLLGLFLTWQQARNASTAAQAAEKAVSRTERQIRASQILVLVPQLRSTVTELETAIEKGSSFFARRQLDSWRWQASNIHGILSQDSTAERRILKNLTRSVGLAAAAGGLLLEENGSVSSQCMKAREAMANTCDELASWVGIHATQAIREGEAR